MRGGGFSFIALMVINPVIILFYQNCSFVPAAVLQARAETRAPAAIATQASVVDQTPTDPAVGACGRMNVDCPTSME